MAKFVLMHLLLLLSAALAAAQGTRTDKLVLEHSNQFEVVLEKSGYVTYVVGKVKFKTPSGYIYCDSARWQKGEYVRLNGNVVVDDKDYRLSGDSVFYDMESDEMLALGKRVELWSYKDSLYAVGVHAYYRRGDKYFEMKDRPTMYINYPDTASMIEVVSNTLRYDANTKDAQAMGDVKISSKEFGAHSECARMKTDGNVLDLFQHPTATRGLSTISGSLISVYFQNKQLEYIDVLDSAKGDFREPVDSVKGYYDKSSLRGHRIQMYFTNGEMSNILTYGQAYSWYYPSPRGGTDTYENAVSGDTIKFTIDDEKLQKVDVIGGAIGSYLSGKIKIQDSVAVKQVDTVDYKGRWIEYAVADSMITLHEDAHVNSGTVSLDAYEIQFDTQKDLIEAYSGYLDTLSDKYSMAAQLQPNFIPVVLKDKADQIYGDYLLYSTNTEKGRIIQSKTNYQTGYYYGKKLFREQKDIFYVDDGRYTTCNAEEPHYNFYSSHMKVIQNDKLIAKPVIFYVERIPIFALPYYVFPLKRGRHSGFLPFTFGQFERGDRYVKNVGYYWAASQYYDLKGAFDYFEQSQTINFNGQFNYRIRYVLDGYLNGNYTRVTSYNSAVASESKRTRWTLTGAYNHTVTPSFQIRASGDFQSDKSYYTDYSQNIDELLNRDTKSQVSFSKRFSKSVSLTGSATHYVNLDRDSRTDQIPNLNLSLPTIYPFGSGGRDANGLATQSWFQKFTLRYSPGLANFASRTTIDSTFQTIDSILVDSLGQPVDTTFLTDTLSHYSRRKYTKITHNPSITLPSIRLGNYLNVVPQFGYAETWIKVYETDQARAANINTSTTYRTYSYNASATANTKLYGTVYPNVFGLTGLRQVLSPSVTYSYTPDINKHPEVRSYVGGGAASSKSSRLSFSLNQLYQAKVSHGATEKNLELLSITSGFGYDFEQTTRHLSDLSTVFQSSALPIISSLSGSMTHSFYKPGTNEVSFFRPYLQSFAVNASLNIIGKNFFFDDGSGTGIPLGADSASQVSQTVTPSSGWSLSAAYSYTESGRGSNWSKSSFVNLNLRFSLTPTTSVTYTQMYDIARNITVRNSVNIVKTLHCWTGSLYWVPVGSNRGFGFRLFVTALPEVKIDNNYGSFTQALQR
jgi:lipopolysaccharide assembly outer membrane protein LptD (OstA)